MDIVVIQNSYCIGTDYFRVSISFDYLAEAIVIIPINQDLGFYDFQVKDKTYNQWITPLR